LDGIIKICTLGTLEKSKDRRGSSRSLIGSLLQRASSFRSIGKKSPKQSSTSELVDIDPKFTNVEFKFKQDVSVRRIIEKLLKDKKWSYNFQIEKDTVIIPLHSPNDSPEELVDSDSDSNITRAVVHVSYEPKLVDVETKSTKQQLLPNNTIIINENKTLKGSIDKIDNVVDDTVENMKIVKEKKHKNDYCTITNDLAKLEESSLSPGTSR
jgi:hypothetical protein